MAKGAAFSAEGSKATGALEADLAHLRPGVRGLIARRRAQGLTLRERIFELHVGQAQPLLQVARALGVSVHLVSYHWLRLQKQIIANSPRSPDDFAVLRERISAMLWQTIQMTCPAPWAEASAFPLRSPSEEGHVDRRASSLALRATEDESVVGDTERIPVAGDGEVGEKAAVPVPVPVPAAMAVPPPPMLAIRLRALEQLARLYDLGLDARAPACGVEPYATSEEIARSVRNRVLELHDRGE